MKITVFNGSPRGANSNTHVIAAALLEGARKAGAEVENIFLSDKKVNHCVGCFTCWHKTPGKCIHRDDMDSLFQTCVLSDIVCFATPVYLWNMTAYLKNFLDRLIPIKRPTVVENNGNYNMENNEIKLPKVVIISNAGFPGDNNFETMKAVMKTMNPILEVYRNCGILLSSKDPDVRKIVNKYLDVVSTAGYELACNLSVSEETQANLNMELMPIEKYVQYISK
ncbi:NADPH-dependent FMN reductase [Anaerovirgula multivorans]|uniref:NADPH-dependent FMN reductase n=1 Tax=Anaerovirgula multivorans TaxID=312168 RepID=A0A239I9Z1_9FIRM|nr:flavodoxin family protein [Anaerovirgula multivorans]SNS90450.1 NADPH-dependent FMN reductase [Anaerovirgula multivorans]